MSLFADICRFGDADEAEIKFDEASGTWTIPELYAIDCEAFPGIPTKELALAILRAIRTAYDNGLDCSRYS